MVAVSEFRALVTTADGRLTKGRVYSGVFCWGGYLGVAGWRIAVHDNTGKVMTFNPRAFAPAVMKRLEEEARWPKGS